MVAFFQYPSPQDHPSPRKYKDLDFNGISGTKLLEEVSAKVRDTDYCHNDPMLNEKIGIFGQASSSQTELKNNKVGPEDLFLFFGWFKNFSANGRDLHHLFGWLQIEEIIEGSRDIKQYLLKNNIQHPHGYGDTSRFSNNTIYVAKKKLELNKREIFDQGYGLFKCTHDDLILTEKTQTRSRWKLPSKYFRDSKDLFLNRMNWENKEECTIFYRGFGQEFILDIEKNPNVRKWAINLIKKHG
jgi:hypothetical protein